MAPKKSRLLNPLSKKSQRQLKQKASQDESLFVPQDNPEQVPAEPAAEQTAVGDKPDRSSRAKGPLKYVGKAEEPYREYEQSSPELPKRRATLSELPARKALAVSQHSSGSGESSDKKKADQRAPKPKKSSAASRPYTKGAEKLDDDTYKGDDGNYQDVHEAPENQDLIPDVGSVEVSDESSGPDTEEEEGIGKQKTAAGYKPKDKLGHVRALKVRTRGTLDLDPAAEYDIQDEQGKLLPFHKTDYAKIYRRSDTTYIERYSTFLEQRKRLFEGEASMLQKLGSTASRLIAEGMDLPDEAKRWRVERRAKASFIQNTKLGPGTPVVNFPRSRGPTTIRVKVIDTSTPLPHARTEFRKQLTCATPAEAEFLKEPVLNRFADAIEALMNNWPRGMPSTPAARLLLMDVAVQYAVGGPLHIPAISPAWEADHGLHVAIRYIDSTSGKATTYKYHYSTPYHFRVDPPFDPHCHFYKTSDLQEELPKKLVEGREVYVSLLPTEEDIQDDLALQAQKRQQGTIDYQGLQNAEILCRKVIVELTGSVATKAEMLANRKRIEDFYRAPLTTQPRGSHPAIVKKALYPISGFVRPEFNSNQTTLFILFPEFQRILGMRAAGRVRTVDGRWLGWLYDKQRAVLRRTTDPFQIILEFLRFIDVINMLHAAGEPPPPADECDENSRSSTLHACHHCLKETPCLILIDGMLGARYCTTCAAMDRLDYAAFSLQKSLAVNIKRLVRRDTALHGLAKDDPFVEMLVYESTAHLQERQGSAPAEHFMNIYRKEPVPFSSGTSAFSVSIDAIFPVFRHESGRAIAHVPGNVGNCYFYENHMKGKMLPGTLMLVAEYVRGTLSDEGLIAAAERFRVVELGIPYLRKSCIKEISEDHWRALTYEFKTGNVLNPNTISRRQRQAGSVVDSSLSVTECAIDDAKKEDLKKITWEIAHRTDPKNPGRLLHRASDGALWPTALGPPPDGYCWDLWYSLMRRKVEMLRTQCNRRHVTTITEFTMFLEIFWALCFPEGLLSLPLRLKQRHLLGLSVGHGVHGKDMKPRFREDAKSIDDRSDDECNIIVETWIENVARLHFTDAEVQRIPEQVKELYVSTEYYDPSAPRPDDLADRRFPPLHIGGDAEEDDDEIAPFAEEDLDYAVAGAVADGAADDTAVIEDIDIAPQPFVRAVPKAGDAWLNLLTSTARQPARPRKQRTTMPEKGTASNPIEASGDTANTPIDSLDTLEKPAEKPKLSELLQFDLDPKTAGSEYYPWNSVMAAMLTAYDKGLNHQHKGKVRMSADAMAGAVRVRGIQLPRPRGLLALRPNQQEYGSFVDTDTLAFLLEDAMRDVELPATTEVCLDPAPLTFMTSVQYNDDLLSEPDSTRALENVKERFRALMRLPFEKKLKEEQFVKLPKHCTDLHLILNARGHFAAIHFHVDFKFTSSGERIGAGRGTIHVRDSLGWIWLGKVSREIATYWAIHPAHEWHNTTWHDDPIPVACPIQGNGRDCGLFACRAMIYAALGRPLPSSYDEEEDQLRDGEELRASAVRAIARRGGIKLPDAMSTISPFQSDSKQEFETFMPRVSATQRKDKLPPTPSMKNVKDGGTSKAAPQYAETVTLKDGARKKLAPRTPALLRRPLSALFPSGTLKGNSSIVNELALPQAIPPRSTTTAALSLDRSGHQSLLQATAIQINRLMAFIARKNITLTEQNLELIDRAQALIKRINDKLQSISGHHVNLTAPGVYMWDDG